MLVTGSSRCTPAADRESPTGCGSTARFGESAFDVFTHGSRLVLRLNVNPYEPLPRQLFRKISWSGAKQACSGSSAPPSARASEPMLPISSRGICCRPSQL